MAKKIEMLNDQQEVVHPLTSSDCVIMENGKTLEEVMGDGVATPTVTHEGASFQVGVGDSNIEVVDGDVAGMTLEGQTYQNILPKPTTLIMETDEKEFKINDKIDNNIVLDDNIAEIATVKGQTYVNVVQEESATEYTVLGEELSGQSITTSGKPEGIIKNATLEGMTLVNTIQEPSEANSVVLDLDADVNAQRATINNTVQGGIYGAKLNGMTLVNLGIVKSKFISNTWGYVTFDTKLIKPSTKYYYKLFNLEDGLQHVVTDGNGSEFYNSYSSNKWSTFTTSTTEPTSFEYFTIHIKTSPTEEQVNNIQLLIMEYQEGMENWDIPYFEGIQSVEVPSVKTTGKNLFDGKVQNGYIDSSNGEGNSWSSHFKSINFIEVEPNTSYYLNRPNTFLDTSVLQCFEYDSNKSYLKFSGIYNSGSSFTTSSSTRFIKIAGAWSSASLDSPHRLQLEKGSTATSYEPYQSSTLTCGAIPLDSSMIEQGSFFDSFELNTQTYEYIKVPSTNTDFYTNRIRSKATFKAHGGDKYSIKLNSGYAIIFGFCKNGLYSAKTNGWTTSTETTITVPNDCDEMFFAIKKTSEATINPSEFSNVGLEIRHTVTLRKVGDVQDELDLETGKLTQRIEEVVLNGSEDWRAVSAGSNPPGFVRFYTSNWFGIVPSKEANFYCDKFKVVDNDISFTSGDCVFNNNPSGNHPNGIQFQISNEKVKSLNEWKNYLTENPITVQFPTISPITKTVDLSIVDQSNNPLKTIQAQPTLTHITTSSNGLIPFISIPSQLKYPTIIKPSTQYTLKLKRDVVDSANQLTVNVGGASTSVTSDVMTITTPDTLTSQDIIFTGKNNVISKLQLIEGDVTGIDYPFFEGMLDVNSPRLLATGKNLIDINLLNNELGNNSHIDENGNLVVTGSYANKTPLMRGKFKENTIYTLSYHYENVDTDVTRYRFQFKYTDGTFKAPVNPVKGSGDVILTSDSGKTIEYLWCTWGTQANQPTTFSRMQLEEGSIATSYEPYKGVTIEQSIDSIPLTSDMFEQGGYNGGSTSIVKGMSVQQFPISQRADRIKSKTLVKVKPNTTYSINDLRFSAITFDKNGGYNGIIDFCTSFTTDSNTYYLGVNLSKTGNSDITPSSLDSLNLTLQEVPQEIVLRSLPNGVKDTLNLTTGEYVQRIGEEVLDGSERWYEYRKTYHGANKSTFQAYCTRDIAKTKLNDPINCDKLVQGDLGFNGNVDVSKYPCNYIHNYTDGTYTINRFFVSVNKEMFGLDSNADYDTCLTRFGKWLQSNPIKIQYRLATPIITKVNLTNMTKLPSYNTTTHYDTIVPTDSLNPNITLPSTIDYNVAIKPSTQYTVRCNTTNALSVNLGGATGTLANGKVTLTTPSTLAHSSLKLGNGKAKEVMVIEGSEIKDNVPFFNGMKNVQMGGIKLVNIARFKNVTALVTANANKTQFTYAGDGNKWGYVNFDVSLLKPNTVYTLYVNVIANGGTNPDGTIKFEVGTHLGQFSHNIPSDYTGIYKKVITSVSEQDINAGHLKLAFRPIANGNQVVIQNPMIIEGDWTHLDEIPFIESEMIIEQPIIRSQGKNLFHIDGKELYSENNLHQIQNNDVIMENTIYGYYNCEIKYFNLKPNKNYILSYNTEILSGTPYVNAIVLDEQKNTLNNNSGMFTVPSNGKIRIKFYSGSDTKMGKVRYYNIQLEEGSSATTYEPFKQHTLSSNHVIGYEQGIHYGYSDGTKYTNADYNSILADVEGLSIAYVTNGASNFTFWDKDNIFISGKLYLDTSLSSYYKNGFIAVPSNAKYMRFASEVANYVTDAYTKATVTGELPLRSLPNGVCDTLNLVTGEYVQRVGEVILNGSEVWGLNNTNSKTTCYHLAKGHNSQLLSNMKFNTNSMLCNRYAQITQGAPNLSNNEGIFALSSYNAIYINSNIMSTSGSNDFKQYLSKNPITVQYELATPIVRKIGLTAKGNYKESLAVNNLSAMVMGSYGDKTYRMQGTFQSDCYDDSPIFADGYHVRHYPTDSHGDYEYIALIGKFIYINILKNGSYSDVIGRQWLSQHPIKVGYISTAQSSTTYSNILKPIFFNNVNVQFMNNSIDIQPTLILQARSTNSYVIDMMKPNTLYTSKFLQSGSGSTFIDGTAISVKPNNTFTSPSTLTNKLMITPLNRQEFMIVEGDVTGLTIPYYKGIRSAYDNVDEIEIYSVGKNLFNMNKLTYSTKNVNVTYRDVNKIIFNTSETWAGLAYDMQLKPNTKYILSCIKNKTSIKQFYRLYNGSSYSSSGEGGGSTVTFTTNNTGKVRFTYEDSIGNTTDNEVSNIMLEEASTATPYQPHKENTTSFPTPTRLETVEVVKVDMLKDMEIGMISANGVNGDNTSRKRLIGYIPVQPNQKIVVNRSVNIFMYDINKNFIEYQASSNNTFTPDNCYFIRFYCAIADTDNITITKQQYKPIALNSLPNGIKDEIIIDPVSNKVKLIQRVGKVVLNGFGGGHDETIVGCNFKKFVMYTGLTSIKVAGQCIASNNLPCATAGDIRNTIRLAVDGKIVINIDGFSSINEYFNYLKQNPLTIYYELATPIAHEIRLNGFPFVYEDGSVQLNTEIPHTTKVKYNVNQEHLINGQNETIIRHDKQIDNLYDYIELYLEEEYRMELFRMQLELSL